MATVRYGIFIPPFGYVYAGDLYAELRFTPDPAKAALGKSYTTKAAAVEACDQVLRRQLYEGVQIAEYHLKCTVEIEPPVTKEKLLDLRKQEFAGQIAEYHQLHAMYDTMSAADVEKVPTKKWNYYQSLKNNLYALGVL